MLLDKPSILTALGITINEHMHNSENAIKNYLYSTASLEELRQLHILPFTATMKVDEKTIHPMNRLSGGASLALAECLAGYASYIFCVENEFPTGVYVTANHIATANMGEVLLASADLVHKGKKNHIWNVDITNEKGKLISSIRVTNLITSTKQ